MIGIREPKPMTFGRGEGGIRTARGNRREERAATQSLRTRVAPSGSAVLRVGAEGEGML